MKRLLAFIAAVLLCVFTVLAFQAVDKNTKQVAGFLDSNVFFDMHKENGQTVITILNEQFKLR